MEVYIPNRVTVFVEKQPDMLLMVRSAEPEKSYRWGLLRGKIRRKENPIEAGLREIREEVGVETCQIIGCVGIYPIRRTQNNLPTLSINLRANLLSEQFQYKLKEILDARYFKIDEIMRLSQAGWIINPDETIPMIIDWQSGLSLPLSQIENLYKPDPNSR